MNVLLRCTAALALTAALSACEDGRVDVNLSAERPATSLRQVVVSIDGIVLQRADSSEDQITLQDPLKLDLISFDSTARSLITSEALDAGDYTGIRLRFRDSSSNDTDNFVVDALGAQRPLLINGDDSFEPLLFTVKKNGGKAYSIDLRMDLRLSLAANGEERSLRPVLRAVRSTKAASISGSVSDSLVRGTACRGSRVAGLGVAIYAFSGSGVSPDDADGSEPEPVASAPVLSDGAGGWSYRLRSMPVGAYSLALTCKGDSEDAVRNDDLAFIGSPRDVSLGSSDDKDLDFR